jgi:hypothetical protein
MNAEIVLRVASCQVLIRGVTGRWPSHAFHGTWVWKDNSSFHRGSALGDAPSTKELRVRRGTKEQFTSVARPAT